MKPGTIVAGKYRVERVLGQGGMGIVVAATHIHLGTVAALKFLNEDRVQDESVVARFLREARACAQLQSEHVCRVSDFGLEAGVPYIVMELLEGTDLSRLLRAGVLDVATAADYVVQACAGLAEAHARGIIHRDLKPSNLFLAQRPDGSTIVKVLDFGVAKSPEGIDLNLTTTGTIVGSPGYMSPEQLRSSRKVDARSDVWALGVVLYRLTSGRQPFKADVITDLAIAITIDPAPPLPEVPTAFEAIVMRCLEKDPERRFSSVEDLAAALTPFTLEQRATTAFTHVHLDTATISTVMPPPVVAESPTTLGSASAAIVGRRRGGSRRLQLGVAAVVLALGGGVWWWLAGDTSQHAPSVPMPPDARAPADAAPVDAALVVDVAPVVDAPPIDAAPVVDAGFRATTKPPTSRKKKPDDELHFIQPK